MLSQESRLDGFTEFFRDNEPRLRQALIAALGSEAGREASSEAFAYGWEHWKRVSHMDNPAGFLYRVGRDRGRRYRYRRRPVFAEVDAGELPQVEPALPAALGRLSERQRAAVLLVHGFQWTLGEVAELLGLSKTTVQNHLERGMASLRSSIGDRS